MLSEEKNVRIEWIESNSENVNKSMSMTNPLKTNSEKTNKLSQMVADILNNEIPRLKNNTLLHSLVLYTVTEKMKTVQTVKNVLSYIKENNAKAVQEVSIKDGEVLIKCST